MRIDGPPVLLTPQETAAAERHAMAAGVAGFTLMERAGAAVAAACRRFARPSQRVSVLCGPGNNGGDGFVVARLLAHEGWSVSVFALDGGGRPPGDAARARDGWAGQVHPPEAFDPQAADLVVDALFGGGLSRSLSGSAETLVRRVNESGVPVLSVDMPSGIDGASGEVRGCAINARLTVTFGTAKPGHYLFPGRRHRGSLEVVDIGLEAKPAEPATWLNGAAVWAQTFPWPDVDGHKYRRGHAVVVSGPMANTGAARMAARGALRIGAGLVTLASPQDALAINASHLTAIMLRAVEGADGLRKILADARKNTVVLGPGLGVGAATCAMVEAALTRPTPQRPDDPARACLLDADALTSFAGDARRLAALIGKAPGPVIITPHDGEFARLFSGEDAVRRGSKLDRARAAAALLGCVVLLKGADTVVAGPDGRATIDDGGSPWLATAGSGDVLSGMIGGLLAQGMPAFEAAAAGSFLHAAAARQFGPGLIAEDLPEQLPAVLRDLWAARSASEA